MNKRLLLFVGLVVAGLALGQSAIGPYLQPRPHTEASFMPPDSGFVTGAIAYGSTNRALYFSDGTQWLPLLHGGDAGSGSGGGDLYWFDAGAGLMYTDTAVALQPDGGSALRFSVASGNNAVSLLTNGARLDFGAGASDYAASDGTGIETPSYWESTRGVVSGPGVITPSVGFNALNPTSLTAANSTALGVGATTFSSVTNALSVTTLSEFADGGLNIVDFAFTQLQVPTWEKQTMSTRILGTGKNTFAEIAERIPCSTYDGGVPDLVGMHTTTQGAFAATTTSAGTGRTYENVVVTDGSSSVYKHPRCGTSTSLYTAIFAGAGNSISSYCQRVATYTTDAQRLWVAMTNYIPSTDTLTSGGYGFRFSSIGGDTAWQACASTSGGAQTCSSTGVTVIPGEEYSLCAYRRTLQAPGGVNDFIYFFVNGQYKTGYSAAALLGVSNITPVISLQSSGGIKIVGVGPMTVESR